MRVGVSYFVYPNTGKGGAESWWDIMSKYLLSVDREIEYVVYTNKRGLEFLTTRSDRIILRDIPWNNQVKRIIWHELKLPSYLQKDNIDIFLSLSGANVFPCKSVCKNIVIFHDLGEYHIENKYDPLRMFYRKKICIPLSIQRADRIIAVSETTKNDLINILQVAEDKITLIYNGPSAFNYNSKAVPGGYLREKWGLGKLPFLFYPCRTDFIGKGLDNLLKAYKIILAQDPSFPMLIVTGGKGMGHDRFIAEIDRLELKDKVRWLGWVEPSEMEALYSEAKLLVFSSKYEGFGFPVTEAMVRGLPVACSKIPSLSEVGGDAVVYFDPQSPENIAEVLTNLLADRDSIAKLREKGYIQVKKFDWETSANKFITIFKEIL